MMLAQLEHVQAATLKDVILIIIGLGGFVLMILNFFKKRSIEPQPLSITQHEPCAKESDLLAHIESTSDALKRMSDKREEDLRINAASRGELHKKIDVVSHKVTSVETSTNIQNTTLAQMNQDIKIILQRLPRRHD